VTESHARVEASVPGTTITLLEHQTHMVRAMLDREGQYERLLAGHSPPSRCSMVQHCRGRRKVLETQFTGASASNACVLADRPGTGKTFEILALIALRPFPGFASEPVVFRGAMEERDLVCRANVRADVQICWRRQYTCVHRTNLIFVGKTVLKYWRETIETQTKLRVWTIEGVRDLRKLYDYVFTVGPETEGSLAKYNNAKGEERYARRLDRWDVILVKNGTVSGNLNVPELEGSWMEGAKTKNIVGLFGILFRNHCFGRVILDDYDTLGIVSSSMVIPSMFTWYVSATRPSRTSGVNRQATVVTLWDQLRAMRPLYNDINGRKDDFIGRVRISCHPQLLERSLKISGVRHWLYQLENPHDRLIGAMAELDEEDLAEMLNANALRAAAVAAGTADMSVAGIFEHLLQSRYRQYCKLRASLTYVGRLHLESLRFEEDEDEERRRAFAPYEAKVRRNLEAAGPKSKVVRIYGRLSDEAREEMCDFIREREGEMRAELDKVGGGIRRVKENIKDGDCPIMLTPLSESGEIFILRCCSVVICEQAAQGLQVEELRGNLHMNCPKCRAPLTGADVICIPQLRALDILEERMEGEEADGARTANKENQVPQGSEGDSGKEAKRPEEAKEAKKPEEAQSAEEERPNLKVRAVVDIIRGREAGGVKVDNPLPGLLEGTNELGGAPQGERKFLIFANHEEMLAQVCAGLDAEGISYRTLRGTTSQLNEIIDRYRLPNGARGSYQILLINGLQFCAGMNLQCTTDLIFTHWVTRRNVACQIGGRAARHGRLSDLQMHYVLYQNEMGGFTTAE